MIVRIFEDELEIANMKFSNQNQLLRFLRGIKKNRVNNTVKTNVIRCGNEFRKTFTKKIDKEKDSKNKRLKVEIIHA